MKVQGILSLNRNSKNKVPNNSYGGSDFRAVNVDKVFFSGVGNILSRYKINPEEIQIFSSKNINIDNETKEILIKKLIEAHEHAKKNVLTGNITKSAYSTNFGLVDGTWGEPATNFNNTSNSSICGERSSVLLGFNKLLKKMSLNKLEKSQQYREQFEKRFKVKYIVMSSAKEIGTDKNASSPCADCLSWFNTDKLFKDDSQIVFFDKDEKGKLCVKMRSLEEVLPFRNEKSSMIEGVKKLRELDFAITPDALLAMKEKNISKDDVLILLQKAKKAREANENAKYTNLNVAASVLTNSRKIKTEAKFDWTKRWVDEPAEEAAKKAIKQGQKLKGNTKIDAVAYYGNGSVIDEKGVNHIESVVSLQTLGKLKIEHGSGSTLVISIADDKIAVRTIDDYMPKQFEFVSSYMKK